MFDVTRRQTLVDLATHWLNEVEMHSTVTQAVRMVVATTVDLPVRAAWCLGGGAGCPGRGG